MSNKNIKSKKQLTNSTGECWNNIRPMHNRLHYLTSICFECSTYFSSVIYVYYTLFVFYSRSQGNTERKNGLKLK